MFINIQKRLPKEVRYKISSFSMLWDADGRHAYATIVRKQEVTGDAYRYLCSGGLPQGIGLAFQGEGVASPTSPSALGDNKLLQATCASTVGTCARDGQGGGWQKQQVEHHGAAAPSVQTLCKGDVSMWWFAVDWPLLIQLAELL